MSKQPTLLERCQLYKQPWQLLGRGGSGAAYVVEKQLDGDRQVIKKITLSGISDHEVLQTKREVQVLQALQQHPFIVQYIESFQDSSTLYIVMEYCAGGTLHERILQRRDKGIALPALSFIAQIALAVQVVHRAGFIHRDLKAQNIFLDERGNIKLGDFGLARKLDGSILAATTVGTPYHLSPEICKGQPYDSSSDIWAFGCIMHEVTVLDYPFKGASLPQVVARIMRGIEEPRAAWRAKLATAFTDLVAEQLDQLMVGTLQPNPSRRLSIEQILEFPAIHAEADRIEPPVERNARLMHCDGIAALKTSLAEVPPEEIVRDAEFIADPDPVCTVNDLVGHSHSKTAWTADLNLRVISQDDADQASKTDDDDELASPVIRFRGKQRETPYERETPYAVPSGALIAEQMINNSDSDDFQIDSFSVHGSVNSHAGGSVSVVANSTRLRELCEMVATLDAQQQAMARERVTVLERLSTLEANNETLREENDGLREDLDELRIDFGNLEDEHTQLKEEFARWRNTHEGTGWSGPDGGNIITSRYQGL